MRLLVHLATWRRFCVCVKTISHRHYLPPQKCLPEEERVRHAYRRRCFGRTRVTHSRHDALLEIL